MASLKLRRRSLAWLVGAGVIVTIVYLVTRNSLIDVRDRILLKDLVEGAIRSGNGLPLSPGHIACQRPSLPVLSDDVMRFIHPVDPLVCATEPDWVQVIRSVATLTPTALKSHGPRIDCSFTELLRGPDDDTVLQGVTSHKRQSFTFVASDYCSVQCQGQDGATWSSLLWGVRADVGAGAWSDTPEDSLGVSVLMLGLDSLSHNTFIRTLPKTYKYLKEALGAEVLDGYNIVGDGTTQALVPMLTGKTELELPETRHRVGGSAQHVDVYPLVWGAYKAAGYVTMYVEDRASINTFNYRLRGFKEQPTHHYGRPFYLALEQQLSSHPNYCLGAKPRHQVFFDYVYNFMDTYRKRPVFAFTLHGELSHDDVNLVSVADDDLVELLRRLKTNGLLDNTLLVLYSDHGHRFQSIRSTQQGKQEERLPFVSFVVPERIKNDFSSAFQNLRANTKRLVTPFDVHATLQDVLRYSGARLGHTDNRAISLFSLIPGSRSCSDAFIEPHWCTCLTWEPVPVTGERVRQAGKALVHYINSHTARHRGLCSQLTLQAITWSAILLPNAGLMAFKQNADVDGFVPNLKDQTPVTEEVYEVHVVTSPGEAHYEAALTYSVRQDTFSVRMSDISLTSKYGSNPHCIVKVDSDMVKFCVCRNLPTL